MQPQPTGTVIDRVERLERIYMQQVAFGSPMQPQSALSDPITNPWAGLSNATHNGQTDNIKGSWVEIRFTARNVATLAFHNLGMPVVLSPLPNVRWINFGIITNSTGNGPFASISINYDFRDSASMTEDAMPLRIYSRLGRVISALQPTVVTLYFIPAEM